MAVSGSRCRGLEEVGSDLDMIVGYRGEETENALFNAFNEDGFRSGGDKVDINLITEGKTGMFGRYLPCVEAYLKENVEKHRTATGRKTDRCYPWIRSISPLSTRLTMIDDYVQKYR